MAEIKLSISAVDLLISGSLPDDLSDLVPDGIGRDGKSSVFKLKWGRDFVSFFIAKRESLYFTPFEHFFAGNVPSSNDIYGVSIGDERVTISQMDGDDLEVGSLLVTFSAFINS